VGPGSDEQLEISRRETFSVLDKNYETTIIARDEEKEELIQLVLETEDEEEISIIPIVGLGGLGKTTIAKLVYNDDRVKAAFNLRAWVYVSQKFDLGSMGNSLINETKESCQNMDNLQDVSWKLEQILRYKKFLVVLDDM
jgi:Cdc6-like AAA superfamily ATPase